MTIDKEALLKPSIGEEEVEIPGKGTVRVRGLNRFESYIIAKTEDDEERERKMLRYGMVAPRITEADAKRWQGNAPGGELEPVTKAINRLSLLGPEAEKDAYRTFRGEPRDGVRVLPSGAAGDDSGPPTPLDE